MPRGDGSRSRMIAIVRTLGAPVTDAEGNAASNRRESGAPDRAVTVDVICQTVG